MPNADANTLRVGVIGCGRIAQPHMAHLRALPNVRIAATCDILVERAKEAAAPSSAAVYADATTMLAGEELDAVYVLTPTPTHADIGCAVLDSGRHLFLEKPLAMSAQEGGRLAARAVSSGKITAVGHQWRYLTGVERARQVLGNSPVAIIHAWYYWTWPLVDWIADRKTGGGQMLDQGIHLIDLARFLGGPIGPVSARYTLRARADDGFPNWDAQSLSARFESGALFDLTVTYALFREIQEQPTVDIIARDLLVRITPERTEIHRPAGIEEVKEPGNPMAKLDETFVAACLSGDRSAIRSNIQDAADSVAVVMAANESAAAEAAL